MVRSTPLHRMRSPGLCVPGSEIREFVVVRAVNHGMMILKYREIAGLESHADD